jgi:hypothetical protein
LYVLAAVEARSIIPALIQRWALAELVPEMVQGHTTQVGWSMQQPQLVLGQAAVVVVEVQISLVQTASRV